MDDKENDERSGVSDVSCLRKFYKCKSINTDLIPGKRYGPKLGISRIDSLNNRDRTQSTNQNQLVIYGILSVCTTCQYTRLIFKRIITIFVSNHDAFLFYKISIQYDSRCKVLEWADLETFVHQGVSFVAI